MELSAIKNTVLWRQKQTNKQTKNQDMNPLFGTSQNSDSLVMTFNM